MMIRFFTLLTFLAMGFLNLRSQTPAKSKQPTPTPPVSSNTATTPAGSSAFNVPRPYSDATDTAIENRLIALALAGPEYDASVHQGRITELDLKRAKTTWLNLLTISTTYNDQSFKQATPTAGQPTYVYPKYYFGITIPLGIIFSQGNQVKTAREAVALGKDQQLMLARTIKDNVLTKYKQYKLYNTLLQMQSELINDVLASSAQAEENFKKGSITVEMYIGAQKTRNEELVKNMNLQLQQDLIRLDIEKMIGVSLDEVLHPVQPALFRKPKS
jgi:outer membrane protein TolC